MALLLLIVFFLYFCGLDEISKLVRDTIKIPSEKKEYLIPGTKLDGTGI